jgi:small multidrug resistance pump
MRPTGSPGRAGRRSRSPPSPSPYFFLSLTLRTVPVGIAYAIWSGVGIILISTSSWIVFGQSLDVAAIVGMALIVAGVLVINLLSTSACH